jgi:two-component system, OmpR family, KDP operon response regulator KdpE
MSLELGKVLVVDDEAAIRRLLRNTLQVNDYRVFEAGTVSEALAMAASHLPDVILLDLGLPDGDGLRVIDTVRANVRRADHRAVQPYR